MNTEDIKAREKAATAVGNTANYWAAAWRTNDPDELWFPAIVSDLRKASELASDLLAQLQERDKVIAAVRKVAAYPFSPDTWYIGEELDRILKGGKRNG